MEELLDSSELLGRPYLGQSDSIQLIIGISLSYILSYLIGRVYIRCSESLSNKYSFSRIFPLISSATCLIIFVVKSSLALSLGLVGALSIVRFRTAIKDPEELVYLFVCIGLGLSSGAEQYLAAILGFLMISIGAFTLKIKRLNSSYSNCLRLSVENFRSSEITKLFTLITAHAERLSMNNLVTSNQDMEKCSLNLTISVRRVDNFIKLKDDLNKNFKETKFNFIEIKNI